MSKTLSTGSIFSIAKTYGGVVTMSAITNALEAVATLAPGHGVLAGDYLEIISGWGRLDKMIVRAKSVATNDVTLEKIDTFTQASKYLAGTGAGSIRRITAWSNLSQVKTVDSSGGDQQWADGTSIDDVVEIQLPTIRSAVKMDYVVFDDPSLPWYADVTAASDSQTPYALRITTGNSAKVVANAYWSLLKVPQFATNAIVTTKMSLSFAADPIRYAT